MELVFSFRGRLYSVVKENDIVVRYGGIVISLDKMVELRKAANTALEIHHNDVVVDLDDYRN